MPHSIIAIDPPEHTRVRRHFSRSFTGRTMDKLVLAMEEKVDELLDDLERLARGTNGPVDLVRHLAFPFPFWVISRILGMPEFDDDQVRSWAKDISEGSSAMASKDERMALTAASKALTAYVSEEVLPWKRKHMGDDVLSGLVAARDEDDASISLPEVLDNVSLLYVAGHETTSNLIANSIYNLLAHPDQLAALEADPTLLPNAVDELNRFDGSIQIAWRYVLEDLELDGVVVGPGTTVFVCVGSANRDPKHFGDTADQLDITRPDAKDLLAFGAGAHYCLGANLARREVAVVLAKIFKRFPDIRLTAEPKWRKSATFRGPDQLMVTI
jgi:cytochrome P450